MLYTSLRTALLSLMCLSFSAAAKAGAIYAKKSNETDSHFLSRVLAQPLADKTYRTTKLIAGKTVLIALTDKNTGSEVDPYETELQLNVLQQISSTEYELINQQTACEVEGGSPRPEAYFLANADQSKGPEIGVICSWPAHHYATCELNHSVNFFKVSVALPGQSQIVNPLFDQIFYDRKGGECVKNRFRNAADVVKILVENGF